MKHRALQKGLKAIRENQEAFGHALWEDLKRTRPEVASYFLGGDPKAQARRMRGLLTFVVAHHDEPDLLVPVLRGTGARHADRGIGRLQYEAVADTVTSVLAHHLGEEWDATQAFAWRDFLAQVTDEVLAAQLTLASAC